MDHDEYVIALRESRAFERRRVAERLLITIMRGREVNVHSWTPADVDDTAKLAEDLAQALVRRLAAREESEISNRRWGATEAV
jgi:hypothetical protein